MQQAIGTENGSVFHIFLFLSSECAIPPVGGTVRLAGCSKKLHLLISRIIMNMLFSGQS